MRILIVDCHSVIFQWPELRSLHTRWMTLAREALVRMLTEYQDAIGVHVAAVFDGKAGAKSTDVTEPGCIQIYNSGADRIADDLIERLAMGYEGGHEITVATSDHLEQQTVNSFGAMAVSVKNLRTLIDEARGDLQRWLKQQRAS